MIPHTQTIFVNDPRGIPGDCMRTAVASLLDRPTESVPHFVLFDDWFKAFGLWLDGEGLQLHPMRADAIDRDCLAFGMSPRDVEHVVVWGEWGMIHDPHPSRAGIDPRQYWALVPVPEILVDIRDGSADQAAVAAKLRARTASSEPETP